jgi:NifB/MoaA-like Fe-S oxidoreductase
VHETPEWIDTNWERQPLWDDATNDERRTTKKDASLVLRPSSLVSQELGHCARQIVATDVPMRCYRPNEAARVIDMLEPYQERYRRQFGVGLVYASDEFYLLSGRALPAADTYDGMPQYSNGVGMARDFVDGWSKAQRRLPPRMPRPTELTLVCGTLIAPVLRRVIDRLNRIENLHVRLLPVVNQFFGETVTVSGLLMAQDVVSALKASGTQRALLPRVMFDHTGTRTLDEYSLDRIAAESGARVAVAGEPDEIARYIKALATS